MTMDAQADPVTNLSTSFKVETVRLPSLETEQDVIENAFIIHNAVRSWLIERNFQEAIAALDILMSMKVLRGASGDIIDLKMRRNGITPDFIHELAQVISIIADYEAGLLGPDQLETAIITNLMHDLGEDFSLLPNETLQVLQDTIKEPPDDLEDHVRRMEILTFDRAYTPEEVGIEIGLLKGTPIEEWHLGLLRDKIEAESTCLESCGFRPVQFIPEPDKKGKYKFSRYIHNDIIDWNLYVTDFSSDEYTAYGKIKDRNDGLGTRIGKNFDLEAYSSYLSQTYQSFSVDNMGARAAKKFPSFRDAIHANDNMMAVLHRIGRTYIQHHPQRNLSGSKGYNIDTMLPVDFQDRCAPALTGYQYVPPGLNPLYIILDRIKTRKACDGIQLNQTLVSSIREDLVNAEEYPPDNHLSFIAKLQAQ